MKKIIVKMMEYEGAFEKVWNEMEQNETILQQNGTKLGRFSQKDMIV